MRSDLVVISWWSNCLGLSCLHNLGRHTENRIIYVVQVGKSAAQKERFRHYLPPGIKEITYSIELPAEHGKVVEAVARDLLPDHDGLWFFDHDVFFLEPLELWLTSMDQQFEHSPCCMCHPSSDDGPSLTCPAFWLSPARLPEDLPSFEPIPYHPMKASRRPDLFRVVADLRMPEKDTLVLAQEFLVERGMACRYMPDSLPRHTHLGGLYLFVNEILPQSFHEWMAHCVEQFTAFYAACPREWVEIEETTLLQRLEEFRQAVS